MLVDEGMPYLCFANLPFLMVVPPFDPVAFKRQLFSITSATFAEAALAVFRYQAQHNELYRTYLHHLRIAPERIREWHQIPFLPIEFFKHHRVITSPEPVQAVFESSGTTQQSTRSRHYVTDTSFYERVSERIFEQRYGPFTDYHILALLPSYLERNSSSLVYMAAHFMRQSQSEQSGFFLHDYDALVHRIQSLQAGDRKILLIGVTFALLDLAEKFPGLDLSDVIVMETGGMKGRRTELTREELHEILQDSFNVPAIHAEYGMTELLSQAYSSGNGIFTPPPWMRVLLRDVNDPFHVDNSLRSGGFNVIDLANVDSCAFIETKDIGVMTGGNLFRVLGRMDNSDIRGCNLLVS